jgi:hypothetical protein
MDVVSHAGPDYDIVIFNETHERHLRGKTFHVPDGWVLIRVDLYSVPDPIKRCNLLERCIVNPDARGKVYFTEGILGELREIREPGSVKQGAIEFLMGMEEDGEDFISSCVWQVYFFGVYPDI